MIDFNPGIEWVEIPYNQFRKIEYADPYLRLSSEDGHARYWIVKNDERNHA